MEPKSESNSLLTNLGMPNIDWNIMLCQCYTESEEASLQGLGAYDWYNEDSTWEEMCQECIQVSRQCQETLLILGDTFAEVCISICGKFALTGQNTGDLNWWDLQTRKILQNMHGHKDKITAMAISSCGKQASTGSEDGIIRMWNLQIGICTRIVEKNQLHISGLVVS